MVSLKFNILETIMPEKISAIYGRSADLGLFDISNDYCKPYLDRPRMAYLFVDKSETGLKFCKKSIYFLILKYFLTCWYIPCCVFHVFNLIRVH